MPTLTLSAERKNQLDDAIDIILSRSPELAREAEKLMCAIAMGSPMVMSRYRLLLGNTDTTKCTPDEHAVLANLLRDAGDTSDMRNEVIRLRLTTAERDTITHAAQEEGITISEYIRRRVL